VSIQSDVGSLVLSALEVGLLIVFVNDR